MNTLSDKEQIDAIRLIIQKAENTGDLELMASVLGEDLTVIIPNVPVIHGKPDGVAFLKSWFDGFDIEISYTPESIQIESDMAYEWCTYDQTTTDKQTGEKASEIGRILWIYKRCEEKWLQSFIIWNTL
ncbi:Ketosteroid isomerase homolog [Pseudarcicella hirudinis]|uniref:Ketosteroid isomerase homolog n=1 Tax=Pseudarcicella hirudinis TaxID=1079859 RepID=A0A1I5SKJ9_9BACT|nr:nuclear transport factor 2 family protein [Pseudarcicella hirudinis]SFP71255.1 Ketosteroid isomerase homolog [Pseudarcicella hirudinis]